MKWIIVSVAAAFLMAGPSFAKAKKAEKKAACDMHAEHADHKHGKDCGHESVQHGDHVDFKHDNHLHAEHQGHYDEHQKTN